MRNQRYFHFVLATALAVFNLLTWSCSSVPSASRTYVPAAKHLGLTQAEMESTDARMPPNGISGYWYGTRAPGLPMDQVSILLLSENMHNLSINGINVGWPTGLSNVVRVLYLPPGRHYVFFNYVTTTEISTGVNQTERVNINIPNVMLEIDMLPGKQYNVSADIGETTFSEYGRYVLGRGNAQFTVSLNVMELDPQNHRPMERRIFLEPYDSSVPVESQAFLETIGGAYIIGFNDDPVRWGWTQGYSVNIGVPAGSHTIQLVRADDNTIYTITTDFVQGSRYVFQPDSNGGIQALNITMGRSVSVTTVNDQTFIPVATQSFEPTTFVGPSITIPNDYLDRRYLDLVHIYISPSSSDNWGPNRLRPGQVVRSKLNSSISLRLPYPLDEVNQYDIMLIRANGQILTSMNVEVVPNMRITNFRLTGQSAW